MYSVFVNVNQMQMFTDPINIKTLSVLEAATQLMFRIRIRQTSYVWIYKIIWGWNKASAVLVSLTAASLSFSLSRFLFNWRSEQPLWSGATPLALCSLIFHPQIHLGIFLFTLPCLKNMERNKIAAACNIVPHLFYICLTFCVTDNLGYLIVRTLSFSSLHRFSYNFRVAYMTSATPPQVHSYTTLLLY